MANLQHRLAALWFADIVGFSQLSHEDESGALEVVQLFQGIARDTVDRYGGHIVKFVGDGALAEFHSTEAAIRAACRLRSSFSDQTKANDLGERDLHIGVHVGEIATTPDGDVYGDGVNATARIMNQAEPGQVLASEDVWHQLRQRKEFQFEELGEHDLRGAGQRVLHSVHVEDETSTEWPEVRDEAPVSRLGNLYDELKRRRVFRVAVAYAIVAWLVTQIAATTVPALFLPAWITRAVIVFAILGFPIAIVLAWAYDITREGLKRTPARDAAEIQGRYARLPLVQRLTAGLVIAAVLIGGWIGWDRWGLGPTDISASTVAILPFDVRATEAFEYLGEGMASLIATKIGGVKDYHSVDSHAVLKFVKRTGLRDIDSQAGRTVAERFGAGHYVLGSVIQVGEQLQLEASVYDSDKQDPTTQISVQGEANELMGLVDQLVGKILVAELGESDAGLASLAAMTTDSLEALKAYLEGVHEYQAGRFSNAVELFQRAVEIDSLFALADYRLAASASWIPDFALWVDAADRALRNSSRLSARYRTLAEASHGIVSGRPLEVKTLLGPYLDIHPNDIEALHLYGEALFHYNDFFGHPLAESREYFQQALELDPESDVLTGHLADIAAIENDFAVLDSLLNQVNSESEIRSKWRPLLAFAIGDSTNQDSVVSEFQAAGDAQLSLAVEKLAVHSPQGRGSETLARLLLAPQRSPRAHRSGHLWLATIHLRAGQWEAARNDLAELETIDPNSALLLRGFYAAIPFFAVSEDEVETLRAEVDRWDAEGEASNDESSARSPHFEPLYRLYLLGLLSNRLGDASGIESALGELQTWRGPPSEVNVARSFADHLEAHQARLEGRDAEALSMFSQATLLPPDLPPFSQYFSPFLWHANDRFTRAELLRENDPKAAVGWYQGLAGGLSWLNLPFAPMSHLRLGEIYEKSGDPVQAASHYSQFIGYWRDSDQALQPLVADVELRLERLLTLES